MVNIVIMECEMRSSSTIKENWICRCLSMMNTARFVLLPAAESSTLKWRDTECVVSKTLPIWVPPPIFSQYMVTYEWEPCRCTVANRPTRMAMSWQQGVRGQLEIVEHKSYPRNQRSLVKHLVSFFSAWLYLARINITWSSQGLKRL